LGKQTEVMGFFKSKEEKELDIIIQRMHMNLSNNYKDNAQDNLREFAEKLEQMQASGKFKEKTLKQYETILDEYRGKLKGYSHKDQKPYWT